MCGRPVEVPPRFAGKDFMHPLCGATLRMSISQEGEPIIDLISKPELAEAATVDLEAIRKSDGHGLFLPRHLRESIPLSGRTSSVNPVSGESVSAGKSPGKASAEMTKALSEKTEGVSSRSGKEHLIRDTSDPAHLRERFNRRVDDLPGSFSREGESVDEPAGQSPQPGNETVPMSGTGARSSAAVEKMNGIWKLAVVILVFIALAAVILMMVNLVPGD